MTLIDISRPIYSGMPVWPGDTPVNLEKTMRIADGKAANLNSITMSLHAGTHVDAPWHYADAGVTMERVSPEIYLGPARVIDARGRNTLHRALFDGIDLAPTPRVLFRTDAWKDPSTFPEDWPTMEDGLPAWLASQGVKIVGFDVPSVDKLASKTLPVHAACFAADLLIIESLDLREAHPGIYEFVGMPLRIQEGDGSPIRAILRSLD